MPSPALSMSAGTLLDAHGLYYPTQLQADPSLQPPDSRMCQQGPPLHSLRVRLLRRTAPRGEGFSLLWDPVGGDLLARLWEETVEELKSHAAPITNALEDRKAAMAAQRQALDAKEHTLLGAYACDQ